ncbi:hypothetical protein LIER_29468 [Lithospermum erythrorhizon]|uniref:Uncharacterized protein n=1 Tax=Lithospermum erythrorhizon TaxID=34254 RepID=A0AAV3RQ77_LITER
MPFTDRLDAVPLSKRGLRYRKLKKVFVLETPLSKDQLTARVKQYVELEELKNQRDQRGQSFKRRQYDSQPQMGLVWCTQVAPSEHFTPLRVSVAEVFSQIDYINLLPKPIEKLIQRGYLKEFVNKGDRRDVPRQNRRSPQWNSQPRIKNEPLETPPVTMRIDTMAGGRAGGGNSRNSRKTYARREVYSIVEATARKEENISFNDKNLVGIEFPHDD